MLSVFSDRLALMPPAAVSFLGDRRERRRSTCRTRPGTACRRAFDAAVVIVE
jgi:hypothetical protein